MEYKKAVLLDWTISSSYNVNVKYIYNERKKKNTCLFRSTELLS